MSLPERIPSNNLKILGKIIEDKKRAAASSTTALDFSKTYIARILEVCTVPGTKKLLEIETETKGVYFVYKIGLMASIGTDGTDGTDYTPGATVPEGHSLAPAQRYKYILPDAWTAEGLKNLHKGTGMDAESYRNLALSLKPEALFLKSQPSPMDAPKWGDDVIVMHDNVEGRYYITSVAGRSKTSKTGGNEPSTTDVTTASNAFDPCDPKKKKEAKKETPPTAKNKPTTNGTKVKASVQCLDRKGMTNEEYYQAEIKVFHKRYMDQLASIPNQGALHPESLPSQLDLATMNQFEILERFDVAIAEYVQIYDAEYKKKVKEAQYRKTLPNC